MTWEYKRLLAETYAGLEDYNQAIKYIEEVIEVTKEKQEFYGYIHGQNILKCASYHHAVKNLDTACNYYSDAYEVFAKAKRTEECIECSYTISCLGNISFEQGKFNDAVVCFEQWLEINKNIVDKFHEE